MPTSTAAATSITAFTSTGGKKEVATSTSILGKDGATKSDEFLEKIPKGGGLFSIQKFILHFFVTLNRLF